MIIGETVIIIEDNQSIIFDRDNTDHLSIESNNPLAKLENSFSIDKYGKLYFGGELGKEIVFSYSSLFSLLSMPSYKVAELLSKRNIFLRKDKDGKWSFLCPSKMRITIEELIIDFVQYILQESGIPVSIRMLNIVIPSSLPSEIKEILQTALLYKYEDHFQLYESSVPLLHSSLSDYNSSDENLCVLVEWSTRSLDFTLFTRQASEYTLIRTSSFPSISITCIEETLKDIAFAKTGKPLKEKSKWNQNVKYTTNEVEFAIQFHLKQMILTLLNFLDECGSPANTIYHLGFVCHSIPYQDGLKPLLKNTLSEFFTESQFSIQEYSSDIIVKSILAIRSSSIVQSTSCVCSPIDISLCGNPFIEKGEVLPLSRGCVLEMNDNLPDFLIPLEVPGLDRQQLECTLLPLNEDEVDKQYKGVQVYLTCSINLKQQVTVRLLDLQRNVLLHSVSFSV